MRKIGDFGAKVVAITDVIAPPLGELFSETNDNSMEFRIYNTCLQVSCPADRGWCLIVFLPERLDRRGKTSLRYVRRPWLLRSPPCNEYREPPIKYRS